MKRPFSAYDHLPGNIDSVAGVRELDRLIIQRMGDNGYQLMRQAGEAAFQCLRERWPEARHICILAGAGNNGGDGWVIAALAIEQGLTVSVLTLGDITRQSPSATDARHMAESAGVVAGEFDGNLPADADLLIDGLLGTGLNAVVQGEFAEAIDAMNTHQAPVFALDIPSGLNASSGMVMGHAV